MDDVAIERKSEEILQSAGLFDEAYARYGVRNARGTTALARFRDLVKRYPHKDEKDILDDLIRNSPGEEGKWFATAHRLGLYDLAIDLANRSPCDPKTLNRAAEKQLGERPEFALAVAMTSLRWLCAGHGYEIIALDVLRARDLALAAAEKLGKTDETQRRIRELVHEDHSTGMFVSGVLRV